jgi:glyoxylase-like metal-dependent hydrolase (beta-lactamase superfamily II)
MRRALVILAALLFSGGVAAQANRAALTSPRLYVIDGGVLRSDPAKYRLTPEDVGETSLSVAAYLIVHPRGVLLWDAGAIADSERISAESGIEQRVLRRDGDERFVTLAAPFVDQLAAAGFAPADVTHLALSHYHWDHTANANLFSDALWIVTAVERGRMFAADPPGGTRGATYSALASSRNVIVNGPEYDVFGDGSVKLMQTPGHTEGHMILYVKLAKTGDIVLSGDLYHYPAERRLKRVPSFDVSEAQTAASRAAVEELLARTGAELWIQHDLVHHRQLELAPAYYD